VTSGRRLLRVAHRGASGHAPENTLAAFQLALELGTDALEFDLRRTQDERLVVLHDASVNRTTNGRGRVRALALAELERLDAGSWFDLRFRGERIPTLEQVLELARPHDVRLLVEVKADARDDPGCLARQAVATVRAFGLLERTSFLSFDAGVVEMLSGERVPAVWVVNRVPRDWRARLRRLGAAALAPHCSAASEGLVRALHRAGYPLLVWTVDKPDEMRRLLELGVDALATNFPDRLNAVLGTGAEPSR
jgi:glycerophosphoryl diester phosphodiesterase